MQKLDYWTDRPTFLLDLSLPILSRNATKSKFSLQHVFTVSQFFERVNEKERLSLRDYFLPGQWFLH